MTPIDLLALSLLWILFFKLYRDYRLDCFRQKLFALRDELFDLAARGDITFDDPAYGMLCGTVNGNIQFGHKFGFLEMLPLLLLSHKDSPAKEMASRYDRKWETRCNKLPEQTKKELHSIKNRLHLYRFEHIVFTSFVLMFTAVLILLWILLIVLKQQVVRIVEKLLNTRIARQMLSISDFTALSKIST